MLLSNKRKVFVTAPKSVGGGAWYTQAEHDALFTTGKFSNAIADTQFKQLIPIGKDAITHVFKGGQEIQLKDAYKIDDYVIDEPDDASGSIIVSELAADYLFRLMALDPANYSQAAVDALFNTGKASYEGSSRKPHAVGIYIYRRSYDMTNVTDDPLGVSGVGAAKTFATAATGLPTKMDAIFYPAVIFERGLEFKTQDNVDVLELKWHAIGFNGSTSKNDLRFHGPLYKAAA